MSGQPRDDREWEHWPHERKLDDGIRHRLRGLFHPTAHGDEAVEEFVAQQGRELELRATQLAETIADLERREQRTADLRVAVEQMLRRGSAELDERHAELAELAARLAEREALATETERLLAERRTELGAVELRRAALERREAAIAEREDGLARRATELSEREQLLAEVEQRADELVARSAEVAAREERLSRTAEAVERDRQELTVRLASLTEREHELSALEVRRSELERETALLRERRAAYDSERSVLTEQREELRRAVSALSTTLGLATPAPGLAGVPSRADAATHVLLVPGEHYRLVEADGPAPALDTVLDVDGRSYRVIRVGVSGLPDDDRRCASLERVL